MIGQCKLVHVFTEIQTPNCSLIWLQQSILWSNGQEFEQSFVWVSQLVIQRVFLRFTRDSSRLMTFVITMRYARLSYTSRGLEDYAIDFVISRGTRLGTL